MNAKKIAYAIAMTSVLHVAVACYIAKGRLGYGRKEITPPSPVKTRVMKAIRDEYLADVISKAKKPYLIAAIKLTESGHSGPYIIGDGGDSKGLYQIQPQHHNWWGDSIEKQTAQCESIIYPLIKKYGMNEGVRRYNGSGWKAVSYSKKVIKLANQIERD